MDVAADVVEVDVEEGVEEDVEEDVAAAVVLERLVPLLGPTFRINVLWVRVGTIRFPSESNPNSYRQQRFTPFNNN